MRDFHLFCTYIHTLLLGFYINGQIVFFFHIFGTFKLHYSDPTMLRYSRYASDCWNLLGNIEGQVEARLLCVQPGRQEELGGAGGWQVYLI